MKILYVSQFFYPEITAAAYRAYDNSIIWKENSVDLTVFTTNPNYPKGAIYDGYLNKLINEDEIDGIRVIRSKVSAKKNSRKLSRGLISLSFMFYGIINGLFNQKKIGQDYDLILGTSGSVFAAFTAYILSKLYGVPFILEIRDITYIQMLATLSNKKSTLYNVIRKLELFLCKKSKKIIVVTEGFKSQLIDDGIDQGKIEVIYNGIKTNKESIKEIDKEDKSYYLSNYNFNLDLSKLTFCYAGTLGISQDIVSLIDFYEKLKIKNKRLILIGEGAEKEKISNYIMENHLDDIVLIDSVSKDRLSDIYSMIDICLVKLKYNEYFSKTMPSKVFDIMYNRKPILYLGPEGEVSSLIESSQCGLACCYNENRKNAEKFFEFNSHYNNMGDLREKLLQFGNNGYAYVIKNYDRRELARKYKNIICELLND